MSEITRRNLILSGGALVVAASTGTAEAATGSVELKILSGGFIFGFGGGRGVLRFGGKRYPLTLSGVSFGATIGISDTQLVGPAFNLRSPQDIEGSYSAASAGLAVAGGGTVVQLSNGRGVVLKLHGRQVGFKLSVAVSGLTIKLK